MKKITKIGSLVLSAAMLFSCAACSQIPGRDSASSASSSSSAQLKPYEVYMTSSQKMKELTSTDSDFSVDLQITSSGSSMSTKSTGNVKAVLNGTDTKYLVHQSSQILGTTVDSDSYYADGYFYIAASGQKVKEKMDLTSFLNQEQGQSLLSATYSENDFDSASITADNGDTTIQTVIPAADAQKIVDSVVKNALSELGDSQSVQFQYSDVHLVTVVGSDGYMKSSNVKCSVTMTIPGITQSGTDSAATMEMKMDMDVSNTYNNPGQPVTVTPPSDLSSYQEIDPASLT